MEKSGSKTVDDAYQRYKKLSNKANINVRLAKKEFEKKKCTEFFASIFTIENTEQFPPVRQYFQGHENEKLNYFSISSEMVKKKTG